jgi:hypothetical protein
MSGEAYELPETRMELREPALDPIEEGRGSLGGGANSDDNIFVHIATEGGPGPGLTGGLDDKNNLSTTSRYIFNTSMDLSDKSKSKYGKKLRNESIPGQKSSLWVSLWVGGKICNVDQITIAQTIFGKKEITLLPKICGYFN